ncbi:MAG: hypothetical protein M1835_005683 [Candelina submexicana]|nr:MAG: hypothetical protein M1835_005683 [Candelina submexicana]
MSTEGSVPTPSLQGDLSDGPYIIGDHDCLIITAEFVAECWQALRLTDWLPQWFLETSQCNASSNGDPNCNKPGEPWTTTLLRQIERGPGQDCAHFKEKACAYAVIEGLGKDLSALQRARYAYVRYNIYSLNSFISTWYTSMNGATDQAGDAITQIIELIDKPKKTNVGLNLALATLGIGLSLIAGPEVAGLTGGALALAKAGNVALQGLQKAPGLAASIWPVGTKDTQPVQINELTTLLSGRSNLKTSLQTSFAGLLSEVMGINQPDPNAFLAFVDEGSFSGAQDLDQQFNVAGATQTLLFAFTTFLVSTALAQNGWHILMVPGVDPKGLTSGAAQCPEWASDACKGHEDLECSDYDANSQCTGNGKYWWYSKAHNSAYTLNNDDNTDSSGIINTILTKNWTTGPLLFENAAICEFQNVMNWQSTISSGLRANYTVVNGEAGFTFDGVFPITTSTIKINNTVSFIPLESFVDVAKDATAKQQLFHPVDAIYNITNTGVDLSCVSQLNTIVATKWKGHWS